MLVVWTTSMQHDKFPTALFTSQSLAFYLWGEVELSFGKDVTQKKGSFLRLIASEAEGFCVAKTRQEVIETISFIHEYRHFQQDFILGIGMWDYIFRNEEIERVLSFTKQCESDVSTVRLCLDGIYPRKNRPIIHGNEREEIAHLKSELKKKSMPQELAGLFTARRLLELDATIYTSSIINRFKWSSVAIDHLDNLKEYHSILNMPQEYNETIIFILNEFHVFLDGGIKDTERLNVINAIIKLLVYFSLNHPDPKTQIELGLTPEDCLPGVRFIRFLNAIPEIWNSVTNIGKDFEKLLISACKVKYPTVKECADGWIDFLEKNNKNIPFKGHTKARLDIIKKIYCDNNNEDQNIYKSIALGQSLKFSIEYDLPFFPNYIDKSDTQMILTSRMMGCDDYYIDTKRHVNAWRFSQFIIGKSKKYECVYSRGLCPIAKEKCITGIDSIEYIPSDEKCLTNSILNSGDLIIRY